MAFIRPNSATKAEFAQVRATVRKGYREAQAERTRCERYGMPATSSKVTTAKKGRTGALRVRVTRPDIGSENARLAQSGRKDAVNGKSDARYAHLMAEPAI